jgi:hypothetical protein
MFTQNKFLNDFMRMRSTLVHEAEEQVKAKTDTKGRKTSKHGTATGEPVFGEVTLATLINEKPHKKDVLDYFREKIAKMVSEVMDLQPS